jgi:RNase H-like domain found in reverse transcriptase
MQNQFRSLAIMAYQNPEKAIFVFADASDEFYGGMITQIDKADLELPVDQQRHEPLAFCSGAFKGAQQR